MKLMTVAATLTSIGLLTSCGSAAGGAVPPGSADAASCAGVLRFGGIDYTGAGDLARQPAPGAGVGRGTFPRCDDGGGAVPARYVSVQQIAGVDPATAVLADGDVWIRRSGPLPRFVENARQPVPCTLEAPTTITGQWVGVRTSRAVRFDGDLRPPYRMTLHTHDDAVVPDGWQSVVLDVAATNSTDSPRPSVVRNLLQRGQAASVRLHCQGQRFVADSIRAADDRSDRAG